VNLRDVHIRPLSARAWSDHAAAFADHNYRQLPAFSAACAARLGAANETIAITCGERVEALANVRVRPVPVLGGGVAYLNGGPLVRAAREPARHAEALGATLEALIGHYVAERQLTLRIQPPLGDATWHEVQAMIYGLLGFRRAASPRPYRTILLDLGRPPAAIRAGFTSKWRNGLNVAERNGLDVVAGSDRALFDVFSGMHERMRAAKSFDVELTAPFYAEVNEALEPADRFEVSLAFDGGRPVAGHVASRGGDTSAYVLGATTKEGRQARAAYLLQWRAIERAAAQGCRWYDLGGIDPEANPGVHRFKQGLGGEERLSAGPFEFRPRSLRRFTTAGAERAFAALRRLTRSTHTAVTPERA